MAAGTSRRADSRILINIRGSEYRIEKPDFISLEAGFVVTPVTDFHKEIEDLPSCRRMLHSEMEMVRESGSGPGGCN
jgi:hypothetical protein